MKSSTVLFMLELDQYINIEHVYCELYQYMNGAKSLNISWFIYVKTV